MKIRKKMSLLMIKYYMQAKEILYQKEKAQLKIKQENIERNQSNIFKI
jgi:hypothetical protein